MHTLILSYYYLLYYIWRLGVLKPIPKTFHYMQYFTSEGALIRPLTKSTEIHFRSFSR